MNTELLKKATAIQEKISEMDRFVRACENNRTIRFYKRKGLTSTVSDYMRETQLYELDSSLRDKFIFLLKEEIAELRKQFKELN